jgi:hypothetical protein
MRILTFILILFTVAAQATDISPGLSIGTGSGQIQDGQRLTSAKLLQLVSDATIQPVFYTGKVSQTNLVAGDTLLVVSGSSGTFHKLSGNQALLQNYHLITDQSVYSTVAGYDTFLLYDPTNGVFGQVAYSNLIASGAASIIVSNLVFATSGTNNLPPFGEPNPTSTNNQPFNLIWDTNGVPSAVAYSNMLNGMVGTLGTNKLVPHVYREVFRPYSLYLTNNLTNVWGFTNIVAITNTTFGTNTLLFTNAPNWASLTNADTIPIHSVKQGSNTTVTLGALSSFILGSSTNTYTGSSTNGSLSFNREVFAHGLGAKPSRVRGVLLCVTNEGTFIAGDEVDIVGVYNSGATRPFSLTANATNVIVGQYYYPGQAGTTTDTATNSIASHSFGTLNWRFKIYAAP